MAGQLSHSSPSPSVNLRVVWHHWQTWLARILSEIRAGSAQVIGRHLRFRGGRMHRGSHRAARGGRLGFPGTSGPRTRDRSTRATGRILGGRWGVRACRVPGRRKPRSASPAQVSATSSTTATATITGRAVSVVLMARSPSGARDAVPAQEKCNQVPPRESPPPTVPRVRFFNVTGHVYPDVTAGDCFRAPPAPSNTLAYRTRRAGLKLPNRAPGHGPGRRAQRGGLTPATEKA